MGRARGGAGRGRRTPADRWAPSSGPRWRARWPRRRAGRPAGEGPPDVGRLRQAADAGVREPAAESGSAPIPSTAFAPPSGGCLPWAASAPSSSAGPRRPSAECVPALLRIASMRPNGSGAASSRAAQARAPASRCPWAARARFPSGRLNGPTSPGERERGAGPRRRPRMRLTGSREGGRGQAGRPQRPRTIAPRGPSFPSPEAKKRGPPSPAGPSGIRGGA